MYLQKIFYLSHANIHQKLEIHREIMAMWVVGTVRVSHCDHNSFSGTAEYMGVIHTKSSKAHCSVFSSFCCDLVWPLRDALSRLTGNFMVIFSASLYSYKSNVSVRKFGFYKGECLQLAENQLLTVSFVSQTSPKVANCNNPT